MHMYIHITNLREGHLKIVAVPLYSSGYVHSHISMYECCIFCVCVPLNNDILPIYRTLPRTTNWTQFDWITKHIFIEQCK